MESHKGKQIQTIIFCYIFFTPRDEILISNIFSDLIRVNYYRILKIILMNLILGYRLPLQFPCGTVVSSYLPGDVVVFPRRIAEFNFDCGLLSSISDIASNLRAEQLQSCFRYKGQWVGQQDQLTEPALERVLALPFMPKQMALTIVDFPVPLGPRIKSAKAENSYLVTILSKEDSAKGTYSNWVRGHTPLQCMSCTKESQSIREESTSI